VAFFLERALQQAGHARLVLDDQYLHAPMLTENPENWLKPGQVGLSGILQDKMLN
jgi:hypothetical protein